MKLAVVGGGGFRVPLVYGALLRDTGTPRVEEVVLHDVSAERLEAVAHVLAQLAAGHERPPGVRTTTDLDSALRDADFVFSAIRVGGTAGRTADERVALDRGLLGQETTGPGGICFALRTIPVMVKLAETIAEHAPNAWLINFTNPAGMVTEAVQQVLGDRAVGICDSPSGLCRRVAAALDRDPGELWFEYFGLNHLGWLKGVRDADGAGLLDGLLADAARLATFEEGRLFGPEWLRTLGMIPNEYLYYFYYASDTVDAIRGGGSRGAFLLRQQREFYAGDGDALSAWRATRHDRERTYMAEARSAAGDVSDHDHDANAGYESEAMAVLEAIALNSRQVLILNTANRSSLPFLDERAVVEVPCVVGRAGPVPLATGQVPAHAKALVQTMKDVERTTIDAALLGSRELAIKALSLHPLVPSVTTARSIFDGYRERLPALQEAFA